MQKRNQLGPGFPRPDAPTDRGHKGAVHTANTINLPLFPQRHPLSQPEPDSFAVSTPEQLRPNSVTCTKSRQFSVVSGKPALASRRLPAPRRPREAHSASPHRPRRASWFASGRPVIPCTVTAHGEAHLQKEGPSWTGVGGMERPPGRGQDPVTPGSDAFPAQAPPPPRSPAQQQWKPRGFPPQN